GLDDAAAVLLDLRVDELSAMRLEAFESAFFVRSHQPRVARHTGGEDRGETAFDGLFHSLSLPRHHSISVNAECCNVARALRISKMPVDISEASGWPQRDYLSVSSTRLSGGSNIVSRCDSRASSSSDC